VQGIGDVTVVDRESLREKWESGPLDNLGHQDADEDEDEDDRLGWDNDDADPFAAIIGGLGGGLGAGLYSLNKPAPKVDAYGQPVGVTPRLVTVSSSVMLLDSTMNYIFIFQGIRQDRG
jgi:hypothetical protein